MNGLGDAYRGDKSQLDCDVHDLLDEANVVLLMGPSNPQRAADLIRRLHDCAEQATNAGQSESAERLIAAAKSLEAKHMPS
jgi:hypothetical protein